jgi:hypothetical protein
MPDRTVRRTAEGFAITQFGIEQRYTCREVEPKMGGRSFLITSVNTRGERSLNVTIHPEPRKTWCSCWTYYMSKKCVHVAGLAALYPLPATASAGGD